ncbi:MAG: hypothetical protein Q8R28_01810, partial [Dehalococcoidia bacterium]|nr:hypothetical protein [Dehalococcoidia bacterium]
MAFRGVASGTWEDRDRVGQLEEGLPVGTTVLLQVQFPGFWPGFEASAQVAEGALRLAGVSPWPDGSPLIEVDSVNHRWHVRWKRNPLWAVVVWTAVRQAVIWLLGITLLAAITWTLLLPLVSAPIQQVLQSALPWLALGALAAIA